MLSCAVESVIFGHRPYSAMAKSSQRITSHAVSFLIPPKVQSLKAESSVSSVRAPLLSSGSVTREKGRTEDTHEICMIQFVIEMKKGKKSPPWGKS